MKQAGFGGPRIPGMGMNRPQGNQFQMNLNVLSLPNATCVKCGCEFFESRANIKMISPMQSPDGQWAHGVAQWWACANCYYKFDPKEWVEKHLKEEENKKNEPIIALPDAGAADK